MIRAICLTHQELSDYCLGTLEPAFAEDVADHVDQCPQCESTLRQLESQPEALSAAMGLSGCDDDPYLSEPELTRVFQLGAEIIPAPVLGPGVNGQLRDYRLVSQLGKGGMGAVYKAIHTRLDKLVAVKLLPPHRTRDQQAVARFQREMKAIGKLQHPNIVAAHDAGEVDGQHFLVMEYIEGLDLSEVARRREPPSIADCCEIARQAALGLDYAHRHGIIHRDVKPSNLMLTANGNVKILDLGLALLQGEPAGGGELTGIEQRMGTVDYMAPEQALDSHSVGSAADIYSLGCTLYKLLSGVVPYGGRDHVTPMQKVIAHVNSPVPQLTACRVDLPVGLSDILDRMLAKQPAARFGSASEVAVALGPFAAGSDLVTLFANARDELRSPFPAAQCASAAPDAAVTVDHGQLASCSAETDATLSSPLTRTEGDLKLEREASPHAMSQIQENGHDVRIRWSTGRTRLVAGGIAALLLFGVLITVKMRDGSTRRFEVNGKVETVTITQDDGAKAVTEVADYDKEFVKWVFDVGGKVAAVNREAWGWPAKWPERPSELPDEFDDLMILLSDNHTITDADLKRFKSITKPFWLNLSRTKITDTALVELNGLANLRILFVEHTRITRNGIESLGVLPNLTEIYLGGTSTVGADLTILSRFPKLTNVQLTRTQLTIEGIHALSILQNITTLGTGDDVGIAEYDRIGHLGQLRQIGAAGPSCNDACLEPLSKLRYLNFMGLYSTNVTDAGIARLPSVAPRLVVLSISGGHITDAGAKYLAELQNIELINLFETDVTEAGVAELKAALPNCKINWTRGPRVSPAPAQGDAVK